MPKILKLQKTIEACHSSADLSDVLVGRTIDDEKKILHKLSHIGTNYRQ